MIVDARELPENENIKADLCIIGAGAAGITIAREFIGLPLQICLLESGGLEYDEKTQSLYEGESVGLNYVPLENSRLRYFGGTTNHWGGLCRPLDPIDFEGRSWIPHSGWPFSREVLDPYYERAQSVLQLGPYIYDSLEYWTEKTKNENYAFGGRRFETKFLQTSPTNFGVTYLAELRKAANVSVYLHANMTELITTTNVSKVTNARIVCLNNRRLSVSAKYYILATGGIENARILLLSNKSQAGGLGNSHDQVGRYFMEHIVLPRNAALLMPKNLDRDKHMYFNGHDNEIDGTNLSATLSPSAQTLRNEELANIRIHSSPFYGDHGIDSAKTLWRSLQRSNWPSDLAEHLGKMLRDLDGIANETYKRVFDTKENFFNIKKELIAFNLSTLSEQTPNPNSRITLSSSKDILGQNRAKLDWQLNPIDIISIRRTLEILAIEFGRIDKGRMQLLVESNNMPDPLWSQSHHIGTTRMSKSPETGVVNESCGVHGVSNLYIAGSSVFPTGGFTPPTLTIVALALRLADHIKKQMTI